MLDLGLSVAEHREYHAALRHSHAARTTVMVLDRDEKPLVDLPFLVTSGAVNVDIHQPVDRSLELELVETDRKFKFIPDGAADFTMFADNFIRVVREIRVEELDRWVRVPVFTGPITTVSHDGSAVSIAAVGKESLALAPSVAWRPQTYPKGTLVTDVIHDVMYAQGERRFDMPTMDVKTRKRITVGRTSQPWRVASRLALSLDRQLFYDARGKLRLRVWPQARSGFTFKDGTNATILTRPETKIDMTKVRNTVEVLGPKPDGPQKRLRWVAYAPKEHALSPWKLARNGEPRFLVESVELEHVHRMEQVRNQAERRLEELLRADLEVTFDSLPQPHLEPADFVSMNQDGETTQFKLQTFTIPLVGSDPMSVGYLRRVSKRRNKR